LDTTVYSLLLFDIKGDSLIAYRINKFFYQQGGTERYLFALRELLRKNGHQVIDFSMTDSGDQETLTVSIGVASFPEDGESVEDLIDAADIALYQAKRTGRNKVISYSELAAARLPETKEP